MRLAFIASRHPDASAAREALAKQYGEWDAADADVIVAIGGDGFMLQTLHRFHATGKPVFGMKSGSVGFLMNRFRDDGDLAARIAMAEPTMLRPLSMRAHSDSGASAELLAFNEVSLLRQTKQAAKIRVWVDGKPKLEELVCDGVMVATPAGSTAYNLSAHGPILPLGSEVLAITPIAPFRPRRWRGAIVQAGTEVRFEVLDHYKRPVSATADASEVRDIVDVVIRASTSHSVTLLFDPGHSLEERILDEQFAP